MKIYRVVSHTEAFRYYFCATKREASALRHQLLRDGREDDSPIGVEIDTIDVAPTRASIAEALNDFVSLTCINEF